MKRPTAPWIGDPATTPKEYITIADVIGSGGSSAPGNVTNSITLNLGVAFSGETRTVDAMVFCPSGLMSIPLGPGAINSSGDFIAANTSPTSAQAVAFVQNNQYAVLGIRDTRTQFTPGNIQPGETAIYAPGSPARTVYKLDGSATTSTTTAAGKQVYWQVSPTALTFIAPWGRIVFDETGFHIATASGATFDFGGLNFGGLPSLSSYATLNAGVITLPGSVVNLGQPGPTGYQQVLYPLSPVVAPTPVQAGPVTTTPVTASQSVYVGL
jgi:hypothetical protein